MANLKAAKKSIRQTKRRTARNLVKKQKLYDAVSGIRKLIEANKLDEAKKKVPALQKILDKAAKTNLIHKKKASRIKKRIAKRVRVPAKAGNQKPKKK